MSDPAAEPADREPFDAELPYDAVLVVSFGGPEGPDDVIPFLENVLRGKIVPRERMLEVAEHYQSFGGVSPINRQNRELIAALRAELDRAGIDLPIYFGNRNWHPLLPDTLAQMKQDGIRRSLAFFTSAYSSYSGCRQYRENIREARADVGDAAPQVEKVRHYFNHPGFIETMAERTREALAQLSVSDPTGVHAAFTAHSIPMSMANSCAYVEQLNETMRLVMEQVGLEDGALVFQSRSGPPQQPWLEPDIGDHLKQVAADGKRQVLIVPIGFISDHMEVLFDLDTEAREIAERLGLEMVRVKTAGTHPRFVQMVRELIAERLRDEGTRPALGSLGPSHDTCPAGCCPYPARRAANS